MAKTAKITAPALNTLATKPDAAPVLTAKVDVDDDELEVEVELEEDVELD